MTTIQVLGRAAGSLSAISFLPQVVKSWKTKPASGISLLMIAFATISVIMCLAYGIILRYIRIIYTNSLVLVCPAIMLYFKFRFIKSGTKSTL